MAEVVSEFDVPKKGIGKPDYSREISSGRTRPGLSLKYGQRLGIAGITATPIASPYISWVRPVLAPDASAHFVDWQTGLPTPYTIRQGYTLTIVQHGVSFTQDSMILIYFSGPMPLSLVAHLGTVGSGIPQLRQDIIGFSSAFFDPDALIAHTVDVVLVNRGVGNLEGSTSMVLIEEAVGTEPYPPIKTVRCKFCGHEWVVPVETTAINCPKCGNLNIYCDFSKFRSL